MSRFLITILGAIVLTQCSGSEPTAKQETIPFLGRWNVVASHGEEAYPLWFELEQVEGSLKGRFQPRGGHSRPLESLSVDGDRIQFSCCGFELEGRRAREGLEGTGEARGEPFSWRAQAAPELPPRSDLEWGEPVDLLAAGMDGWKAHSGDATTWELTDGVLVNSGRGANIFTTGNFKDFKLHIEVNCPEGSNSGIYLRGRYEIQVQDDYGKPPHSRHMGGIYGYVTPSENTARPAGEWQEIDVTLNGRWVTLVLNGETVIDQQEIPGITGGALDSREAEPGHIYLQGDHGAVSYRNLVLTPAAEM